VAPSTVRDTASRDHALAGGPGLLNWTAAQGASFQHATQPVQILKKNTGPNAGLQRIWTAVILSLRLHFNSLKTLQAILLLEFLQQFYSLTD
jgi:hypothetical protein